MRVTGRELEERIAEVLGERIALSPAAEASLIASAESLLAARRERLFERRAKAARAASRLARVGSGLGDFFGRLSPSFRFATAAAVASLLALLLPRAGDRALRFANLAELPRFNSAPARYDALWLEERQAYEKEIENAHDETSGGL